MNSSNLLISNKENIDFLELKIIRSIAGKIHDGWSNLRLVKNTLDTYKVRWKDPEDMEFENFWDGILAEGEQLSVGKGNNGKIYIDIANTHANQLTDYWKNANREVCEYSVNIMLEELSSYAEMDSNFLDEVSVIIHDFWRSKNPGFKDHFLFGETGERLLDISKGNISIEYIEYIRTNKDAHRLWESLSYETRPGFGENLFDATDEQIKQFLIEQVTFDLKKDLDKFIETIDIAKKITNNDFSKLQGLKDEIIETATKSMHEVWRKDRILDEEGTFETRWKYPNSGEFEQYWDKKLNIGDSLSVRKNENSKIEIDIANTSFGMLTPFWKSACVRSSNFAISYINRALKEGKEINSELILEGALLLNNNWLDHNGWAKDHFIMGKYGDEILDIAIGNVDKDFINSLRTDETTHEYYCEFCKTHENFTKNISSASYDELVFFLIHEAKFIIRKNTDIMLYAVEEITQEKFPNYQINSLLSFLNGDSIIGYLSNQDSIVDFGDIIKNKVRGDLFYSDVGFSFSKASDFKLKNGKSINEIGALCCSYSKLKGYSSGKLKELGIFESWDLKIFKEYKEYVKKLESIIKAFTKEYSKKDRKTLDGLLEELSRKSGHISRVGTILDYENLIGNGVHKSIPIKNISRIMEKVLSPGFFDGDFSKMSDIVRATLEFDNVVDLYNGLEEFLNIDYFKKTNAKVLIKDNIGNPLGEAPHYQKYRDINCIIKLENGHSVELQFQLKPMLQANNKGIRLDDGTVENLNFSDKDKEDVVKIASKIKKPKIRLPKNDFVIGHEIYEIWRSIGPKDYSSQELKEKLNQLLIYIHQKAFEKSMYTQAPQSKIQIHSYQMEIRQNLNKLLNVKGMETEFLDKCKRKFTDQEIEKIEKTISLIKKKHKGQYRDENTPYYSHCIHTSLLLLENGGNFEDVIIGLLHDIVEDSDYSKEELYENYGKEITDHVFLLSKSVNGEYVYQDDFDDIEYYKNLRKNKKALKYKAYDRLSNLISTYFSSESYKEKYIKKTKKFLLPILQEEFPELAEKYIIIFKFLEKHSLSEDEIKIIENFKKIREIEVSLIGNE